MALLSKAFKVFLITFLVLILFLGVALIFYKVTFSQKEVADFEVGSEKTSTQILIATQGSEFKDNVLQIITSHQSMENKYIKIVDVSRLDTCKNQDWSKIIIISSIESSKIHEEAGEFINNYPDKNKITLLATSGSGKWSGEVLPVDTITTASKKNLTEEFAQQLIARING
ncbi:MAG: hypothetical protein MJB14_01470 [Spirochaetes bacterium]|nr:hypothetical protein [Spirochaetota bacterium]